LLHAQKTVTDSSANFTLKELNLTPEQKITIKKLIGEYKIEERKKRRQLRHRIFLMLNVNQQRAVRNWWRIQLKNSVRG